MTTSMTAQTPSIESILQEARLLNSDIGRHSVKCNFSTRLSGRFYQNSSLERNTARKSKLLEMQARKRRLEHELLVEEQRVKLLEERLHETERSREDANEVVAVIGRGVVAFQTYVRRNRAVLRFEILKREARARMYVAMRLQSRYRGWKGRIFVRAIREENRRQRRNRSAVLIQTAVRRIIQRRQYIDLLSRNRMMSNQSASAIQAMLRGKMTRQMYQQEIQRRQSASNHIQRVYRGKLGRDEYHRLQQLWLEKQKKPKRVPLHMRRYSTYGNRSPRKVPKKLVMTRRRSSVEDMSQLLKMKLSNNNNDQDENDSVATTLTSLTHATDISQRKRAVRGKMADSTNKANKPSWPSTHRVLGSVPKQHHNLNKSSETKSKSSDASETNTSRNNSRRITRSTVLTKSRDQRSINKELNSRVPTFVSGNLSKDQTQERQREDESPTHVFADSANDEDVINSRQNPSMAMDSQHSEMEIPSREQMSTPLIISREASLLVEEVLGKTIIMHSIVSCTFDDEFSEHEDDLG